ncbi:MAG: cytochrome c biogenesis protein CcsA [Cytophagaceae bacterium]|nr:cytochrome c biogenesis protein CcsA [Cytophagaceae bacterium]MDW8455496.1 cytochrome c biogenesis protein CcsA [Cytophagaceae bacterium]
MNAKDKFIQNYSWKILSFLCVVIAYTVGLVMKVPNDAKLNETIRNLYYHVPMWFGMTILLIVSLVYAIKYLSKPTAENDFYSSGFATTGVVYGILGIITGMFWGAYAWGTPWEMKDPKMIGVSIGMILYLAYFVLRGGIADTQQRARISAVYNVFAFPSFIALIYIMPRLAGFSLHPGKEGNPGLNPKDADAQMRIVFYISTVGVTLLGVWITLLQIRIKKILFNLENQQHNI